MLLFSATNEETPYELQLLHSCSIDFPTQQNRQKGRTAILIVNSEALLWDDYGILWEMLREYVIEPIITCLAKLYKINWWRESDKSLGFFLLSLQLFVGRSLLLHGIWSVDPFKVTGSGQVEKALILHTLVKTWLRLKPFQHGPFRITIKKIVNI